MRQLLFRLTLPSFAALMCIAVAVPAQARKKKKKPPELVMVVKEKKKTLGTETLRTKRGETKVYHSTKTKMRHNGRSFTHRTHTILDPKQNLITYDRWLDVKGATLRIRVFRFKDTFKRVEFSQDPRKKNKVDTIKIAAPVVVLDERSPTLLDLAIERFQTHKTLNWVRADNLKTGTMKLEIERLIDGKGAKWSRYHLAGDNLKASVLRGPDGKAVFIDTGWGFTGSAKGKKAPTDLKPDAAATAPVTTEAPEKPEKPAPSEGDVPKKAEEPKKAE